MLIRGGFIPSGADTARGVGKQCFKGSARQPAGSWAPGPGGSPSPWQDFSNKFQMKSVRLLSNIIFGDSQTRSVPVHCASSWTIRALMPGATLTLPLPRPRPQGWLLAGLPSQVAAEPGGSHWVPGD